MTSQGLVFLSPSAHPSLPGWRHQQQQRDTFGRPSGLRSDVGGPGEWIVRGIGCWRVRGSPQVPSLPAKNDEKEGAAALHREGGGTTCNELN